MVRKQRGRVIIASLMTPLRADPLAIRETPLPRTLSRAYLVLYNLPFPLEVLPPTRPLSQTWQNLVNMMASWVGESLFNVEVIIQSTGTGDTMLAYMHRDPRADRRRSVWRTLRGRRSDVVRAKVLGRSDTHGSLLEGQRCVEHVVCR